MMTRASSAALAERGTDGLSETGGIGTRHIQDQRDEHSGGSVRKEWALSASASARERAGEEDKRAEREWSSETTTYHLKEDRRDPHREGLSGRMCGEAIIGVRCP